MNTTNWSASRWWAYLQLMRPANILTAWADILVGFAVSGSALAWNEIATGQAAFSRLFLLAWLLLATTGLYGGGVVFNDVFDAKVDAEERPERPIPSDRASLGGAILLGILLLTTGIIAAAQVSKLSAILAVSVAGAALAYDAISKHHSLFGPLNMGLCRAGNLLLGVSVVPAMVKEYWYLGLIPILYISAITAISQGEVEGGKKSTGILALVLVDLAITSIFVLGFIPNYQLYAVIPFGFFLMARVFPPFVEAALEPEPWQIQNAVKAGILSLIVLDAALAAGFAGLIYGLGVLLLLPLSLRLSKLFAVT